MASMAGLVRKISKIGNSQGIILTKTVIELLNWDNCEEVELKIDGHKLIVVPHRHVDAGRIFDQRRKLRRKSTK
jgi:antitoxin component of MazEF toxin-antitoxin module